MLRWDMLAILTSLTALTLLGASAQPHPSSKTMKHRGQTLLVTDGGMAVFVVEGPTFVTLELRGPSKLHRKRVPIELVRNDRYSSANGPRFRKKNGGPAAYPTYAKLGFKIPDGKHTYTIKAALSAGATLVIGMATGRRAIAKKWLAAEEIQLEAPTALASQLGNEGSGATEQPEPGATSAPTSETILANNAATGPGTTGLEDIEPAAARPANAKPPAGLERAIRVAVYDFELQGIESNIGTVVTDSMLAEIRKLQGVAAIGMDEIRDMLSHEANKQMLGCEADDTCLAEIAGALGVDNLLTGKLSKVGDSHVLLVRRMDQARAKVAGTVNKRLKAGSGQEFLLAVGPSIEELFPERNLKPGNERGVPKEVALRLDPPPLPTWSFWGIAGTSGAALAAGGMFGLLSRTAQSDYRERASASRDIPIAGADLNAVGSRVSGNAGAANILFGTGAALAVGAAIMYLFTDWQGYGAQPAR